MLNQCYNDIFVSIHLEWWDNTNMQLIYDFFFLAMLVEKLKKIEYFYSVPEIQTTACKAQQLDKQSLDQNVFVNGK